MCIILPEVQVWPGHRVSEGSPRCRLRQRSGRFPHRRASRVKSSSISTSSKRCASLIWKSFTRNALPTGWGFPDPPSAGSSTLHIGRSLRLWSAGKASGSKVDPFAWTTRAHLAARVAAGSGPARVSAHAAVGIAPRRAGRRQVSFSVRLVSADAGGGRPTGLHKVGAWSTRKRREEDEHRYSSD